MIEAVIFDMDGLLIDSEPFWAVAETEVLTTVGVPAAEMRPGLTMGLRMSEVVAYWFARYPWTGPSQPEVERQITDRVITLVQDQGSAMPGALETVALFAARKFPLAVASSSANNMIAAVMERLGIGDSFAVLQSAEHEAFGKPHPAVYLAAASRLGVRPDRCLAFEDSPNGVIAAKAARMTCIAVPSPALPNDRRLAAADLILPSLSGFDLALVDKL